MKDTRYICSFPQRKYCGSSTCKLAHKCCVFPIVRIPYLKDRRIYKTYNERLEHSNGWFFYNYLFGDLKEKKQLYRQRKRNEQKLLQELKKHDNAAEKFSHIASKYQSCVDFDCFNCPYDDCILDTYDKEYNKVYYQQHKEQIKARTREYALTHPQQVREYGRAYHIRNFEKISKQHREYYVKNKQHIREYQQQYRKNNEEQLRKKKAEYRSTHRAYLANSEKIRNYRKRGYSMNKCILFETTNPNELYLEGTQGYLTIIPINGNDYISFIGEDKATSFRYKIAKRLNDLSNPLCTEAWYEDSNGYQYTFHSMVNTGNPLWEMEKNNNFIKSREAK